MRVRGTLLVRTSIISRAEYYPKLGWPLKHSRRICMHADMNELLHYCLDHRHNKYSAFCTFEY